MRITYRKWRHPKPDIHKLEQIHTEIQIKEQTQKIH